MKINLFRICAPFFFIILNIFSGLASAATYEVTVKSILPEAEARTAICVDEEICFLTLPLPPEVPDKEEYLDVALRVQNGEVRLQFMRDRQYLVTSQNGQNFAAFDVDKFPSTGEVVDVFARYPSSKDEDLRIAPVLRPAGQRIAKARIYLLQQAPSYGRQE